MGDKVSTYGLSKAIGEYLQSKKAVEIIKNLLIEENEKLIEKSHRVRAHTTCCWLYKLGYNWKAVSKGIYIDGHE